MKRELSVMKKYSIIAGILVLMGFSVLVWYEWQWLFAYLLSVNIVTLMYYGFDKGISHTNWTRVPEKLLHILAVIGGSPAALLGQQFFRHKTKKRSFQLAYWGIVLVQIGLIFWYFWDEIKL